MSLTDKLNGLLNKGREKQKILNTSLTKIKSEVTTFVAKI